MTDLWEGDFLYRYRKWDEYTKKLLENEEFYYAPFDSLNDPNEGRNFPDELIIDALENSILPLITKDNEKNNIIEDIEKMKTGNENILNKYRSDLLDYLKELGVVCLTNKFDNNPMWHFYADESKGVCLEFYFPKIININYKHLVCKAVKYNNDYTLGNFADSMVYTKDSDWNYENEFRLVVTGIKNKNDRIKKYPRDQMLFSVIVGHNMSKKDFDELNNIIEKINKKRNEKIGIHKRINSSYGMVFEDQDKWNNRKNEFQHIIDENRLD
ncbi:DUF2971 domain-containing protein [Acinetobacter sp. ANC 5502]